MKISSYDYWKEVADLAENVVEESASYLNIDSLADFDKDQLLDQIQDTLHETIDGHSWIIYYSYNLSVLEHSKNEDYAIDNFGSDFLADTLKNSGLNGLHSALAFWALYADVYYNIDQAIDSFVESLEDQDNE